MKGVNSNKQGGFPEELDIKYILAILNSSIVQFYFKKKFNSIKVLRSHIEQIPIPFISKDKQKEIINLVNKIIDGKKEYLQNLDKKIADIYEFSEKEYSYINSLSE